MGIPGREGAAGTRGKSNGGTHALFAHHEEAARPRGNSLSHWVGRKSVPTLAFAWFGGGREGARGGASLGASQVQSSQARQWKVRLSCGRHTVSRGWVTATKKYGVKV